MENNQQQSRSGQQAYKEKRAKRRQARMEKHKALKHRQSKLNLGRYFIIVIVLLGVGFGAYRFFRSSVPQEQDLSKAIPVLGVAHIAVGAAHPPYNSNPPTSGWHYSATARTGFRDEAIPDEHIVHNLEHGDIWISFHPRIADDVKEQLKKFAGGKVIITPREANDTDIALAAWGRLDTFNIENGALDERRIRDFISRYINRGPERVGPSTGGV